MEGFGCVERARGWPMMVECRVSALFGSQGGGVEVNMMVMYCVNCGLNRSRSFG